MKKLTIPKMAKRSGRSLGIDEGFVCDDACLCREPITPDEERIEFLFNLVEQAACRNEAFLAHLNSHCEEHLKQLSVCQNIAERVRCAAKRFSPVIRMM
jgi:hypothetical protein